MIAAIPRVIQGMLSPSLASAVSEYGSASMNQPSQNGNCLTGCQLIKYNLIQ